MAIFQVPPYPSDAYPQPIPDAASSRRMPMNPASVVYAPVVRRVQGNENIHVSAAGRRPAAPLPPGEEDEEEESEEESDEDEDGSEQELRRRSVASSASASGGGGPGSNVPGSRRDDRKMEWRRRRK